jgi:hypothetical protein
VIATLRLRSRLGSWSGVLSDVLWGWLLLFRGALHFVYAFRGAPYSGTPQSSVDVAKRRLVPRLRELYALRSSVIGSITREDFALIAAQVNLTDRPAAWTPTRDSRPSRSAV